MVAHRGAQIIAPENTVTAFRMALKRGFKAIECDVQSTKDGHLVIIHDETVDRTTDGHGWVSQLTYDQIAALTVEGVEHIPTIHQAYYEVAVKAKRKLIVEIKADSDLHARHTADALAVFLNRMPARFRRNVEVHSFWYHALITFKAACPSVLTAAIVGGGFTGPQIIDIARATGANGVSLNFEFISPKIVRECHQSKLFVDAWAIPDGTVLQRLRRFGINAIVENFTGKMLKA
ncbi:MAG: glycerophosphoryl diester phosphodiesterase [Candidatus Saccharibacteria bacterium]|nr:glycerophosphoryl diester phosphodiesterase [Candidatus Saccharibacteria bacterium]